MNSTKRQAYIVVDLGYGDAGKGTIVDYLTREHRAHTVVRFNGGGQAAHNVITPDGKHHTFSQFGSGTFVDGVRTFLSCHMIIEPYALFNEEAHLSQLGIIDAFSRLSIDRRALVTTLYQQAANRLKERARGANRHGSCGVGIGETVADSIQFGTNALTTGDLPDKHTVTKKLHVMREAKWEALRDIRHQLKDIQDAQDDIALFEDDSLISIAADNYQYLAELVTLTDESALEKLCQQDGTLIFEGAQGVLLDENYGFAPYTTWSTTTPYNADHLLVEAGFDGDRHTFGILRTYMTRHGAGPFVTEVPELDLPEAHNTASPWQQAFRVGYFDAVASRYALNVARTIDSIALTHLDKIHSLPAWQLCESYFIGDEYEKDLSEFFKADAAGRILEIKVRTPVDLQHQHVLANHLFHCHPLYQSIPPANHQNAFIEAIEGTLNVPISLLSTGPTAKDKIARL